MVNYDYLRPKKAAVLKDLHNKGFHKKNDLSLLCVSKATVLPLKKYPQDKLAWGRGGVVDEHNIYVEQSAQHKLVNYGYQYEECDFIDEKVVFCGYFIRHWGHFIIDSVARLWYYLQNDDSISKYVFFTEYEADTSISGNYREFFELLGVYEKILVINRPTVFREVVISELSYDRSRLYYSDYYLRVFEKIRKTAIKKDYPIDNTAKKVYFTRSALGKAKSIEIGLEVLDNYFSNNGFAIIAPEKISLTKMINIINNAEICASISGTLPHNMLFGENGQHNIIIERNSINNVIQPDINIMKDLCVTYIDANLSLYPVELSYGPFIYAYNKQLERYTLDNGNVSVDDIFLKEKHFAKCLRKYFALYKNEHFLKWYSDEWMVQYTDIMYEAYLDSMGIFGQWINGEKPLLMKHYFSVSYIKKAIKRLFVKVGV